VPYRPPLVPYESTAADPPDLPVRGPGEQGLVVVIRAVPVEVQGSGPGAGVLLSGAGGGGIQLWVEVRAVADGVIRVRVSRERDARSRSAAAITLVDPPPYEAGRVEPAPGDPGLEIQGRLEIPGRLRVVAGPLVAEVSTDPWHLEFADADGNPLLAEDPGTTDISGRVRTLPLGYSTAAGDPTPVAYHESFTAAPDEHFVGLGERFTGFDKRGQQVLMWNYDAFGVESDRSYKNIPWYLSSRGYGLLVGGGAPVRFDLCASTGSSVQIVVPDDLLDYYVVGGGDPAAVLRRYARLTGHPTRPPRWAFGTWVSSSFIPDDQERVLSRARRLRADGVPADVLHLDCYWQVAGHWSDQAWDAEHFPDPAGMLATLAEQGFRVCLWINSYVSRESPLFRVGDAAGYFLRRPEGGTYLVDVWNGFQPPCGIVDFTNPDATAWFTDLLRPLLRQGVAAFKTDFAEAVPADAVSFTGMRGVDLHNVYSLLYNDAVAAVTGEVTGHRLVWARSTYTGGQRHAAQWGGDANASYPALAATLRGGLSHGLSGVPFWSHDAGGFAGTPTPDLYARWVQFGALSPLLRLHGTTSRLPWDFPEPARSAAIEAIRLRYRLMPYLLSAAADAAETGLPMLRALLVDHPDDPAAWQADLEYLLGGDLLVAPVIGAAARRSRPAAGSRRVYLPEGRWMDWWSGRVYGGGRHVGVDPALAEIPLFARLGALIPVAAPVEAVGDRPFPELCLVSVGGLDARTTIRDVDGDTEVVAVRRGEVLDVTVTGPAPVRAVCLPPRSDEDGGTAPPARVLLGGAPVPLTDGYGLFSRPER
jgi:alpha-D-xyloside xylohydrolase